MRKRQITINLEQHPEGLSSTYAEAIVDEMVFTSAVSAGLSKDGNPRICRYREGAVYSIIEQLHDEGFEGANFVVVDPTKPYRALMHGTVELENVPLAYLSKDNAKRLAKKRADETEVLVLTKTVE